MKNKLALKIFVNVLVICLGLGLLLYPAYTDKGYRKFQDKIEKSSKDTYHKENGAAEVLNIPAGAVAKIVIPKINLQTYVLEGTTAKVLNKGPGHYEETPLPGEDGNSAIAGHRTMYGHPFRHLDQLRNGDEIITYTNKGKFTYRVVDKRSVKPTNLSVVDPSDDSRLTLTTCHPVGSARQRLVVMAVLEKS